jgi:hypothetical protein
MLFRVLCRSGSSAVVDLTMRTDPGSPVARPPDETDVGGQHWPVLVSYAGELGCFHSMV